VRAALGTGGLVAVLAATLAVMLLPRSLALSDPAGPAAVAGAASCATPPALSAIDAAFDRTATRIQTGKPLTIVAMGSSSTKGVGASTPESSYPSRLEQELKYRFPNIEIRVINHGVGGQDVPEELARIDRDIVAEHPDLVIWQVGTNAVLRRDDLSVDKEMIERGILAMKERGIDVLMMDLQYAPRVLARPTSAEMERLIVEITSHTHIGLFRRFEIMREWDRTQQLAPVAIVGPDGLHMTDASYGCLANQLAEALAGNWLSHAKLARSSHTSSDAIAGIERAIRARPAEISRPR
jgi:acyl-CoA thioesterase I